MLPYFIHYQNAILHVQVMVKCSKTLVTKKTWGRVMRVKNRMFGWKFSKVLERLEMCQDWTETSGQDCSGYLSHLKFAIRSS